MPSDTLHPTRRNAGETKFCLYYAGNTCSQKEVFPLLLLISGQSREGRFERSQQQSKSFSIGTDSLALSVLMGPRCLRNSTGQLRSGKSVGATKRRNARLRRNQRRACRSSHRPGTRGDEDRPDGSPLGRARRARCIQRGSGGNQRRSTVRPFSIAPCSVRCIKAERETAERSGDAAGRP
jgi:hypothetical protein